MTTELDKLEAALAEYDKHGVVHDDPEYIERVIHEGLYEAARAHLTAQRAMAGDKKGRAIPFEHLWKDRPWWGEEASDKTRAEYWFRLGRDSALTPQSDAGEVG